MVGAADRDRGRIRAIFARLSTGTKMLLILTTALLPLGLIALFASIQSAHGKRLQHEADARLVAISEARQIDLLVTRATAVLRSDVPGQDAAGTRCAALLAAERSALGADIRLALFAPDGRLRCATPGFAAARLPRPREGLDIDLLLLGMPDGIRFTTLVGDGGFGVGELPLTLLRRAIPAGDDQGVVLSQGDIRVLLSRAGRSYPLDQHIVVDVPIGGGQIGFTLTKINNAISAIEVLLVLLPLLMWGAAAAIGWIVVDQLLLRPLRELEAAVSSYDPAGGAFDLPRLTTPALEIRSLGEAFHATTEQIAQRGIALENGLARQTLLTREVHHRVKNNLQVVASLINLHARGADGDVGAAYASIQRRVDALAVVHRNHFAELEENRGVALRALISELTANLRATAPPAAAHLTITLDMIPAFISQDVAVPVAFLVTEIVELVMSCDPRGTIALALAPAPVPDRALLSIVAPGLTAAACQDHQTKERFDRIVTGLARQLRAPLEYDEASGRYQIAIAIVSAD